MDGKSGHSVCLKYYAHFWEIIPKELASHWAHVNYSLRLRRKCTFHIWRKSTNIDGTIFLSLNSWKTCFHMIGMHQLIGQGVFFFEREERGESWYYFLSSDICRFQRCNFFWCTYKLVLDKTKQFEFQILQVDLTSVLTSRQFIKRSGWPPQWEKKQTRPGSAHTSVLSKAV